MAKRTSANGIKQIARREGVVLKVYKDSKGLPTVGVGHLILPGDNLRMGDKITQAQSDAFLADDLRECEDAVNSLVKVPLSQNQFDALVSFIFNIGVGGFKKSTVLKRLNNKDYDGAAKAMMMWVKPPEITGRRKTEVKQFLTKDLGVSQDAATDVTPPTKIAPLVSSGESQPPTILEPVEVPQISAAVEEPKAKEEPDKLVSIGNKATAVWTSVGATVVAIGTFLTSTPVGIAITIVGSIAGIAVIYMAVDAARQNGKEKRDAAAQLARDLADIELKKQREAQAFELQKLTLTAAADPNLHTVTIKPPTVEMPNSDAPQENV